MITGDPLSLMIGFGLIAFMLSPAFWPSKHAGYRNLREELPERGRWVVGVVCVLAFVIWFTPPDWTPQTEW